MSVLESPSDLMARLDALDYLVDEGFATALFRSLTLGQPLLLEEERGLARPLPPRPLPRCPGRRCFVCSVTAA